MRRVLDQQGRYGSVTIHHGRPDRFMAPKYIAHRVFSDIDSVDDVTDGVVAEVYESVRPYGGVLHLITERNRTQTVVQG